MIYLLAVTSATLFIFGIIHLILQISVPFLSAAKETEPKERPPTHLLGKNQLRSAKGVEVPVNRLMTFFVQGTNAFFTLHYVDFSNANQLSRRVVLTKILFY